MQFKTGFPLVLAAIAMLHPAHGAEDVALAAPAKQTVQVIVKFGDGVEVHYTAIPIRAKLTALDALQETSKKRRGVRFDQRGAGSTAMVTRIDDVANEGGGRTSRNWIYRVNGKKGDVSAGIHELKPSDVVLWSFETYDYNRP